MAGYLEYFGEGETWYFLAILASFTAIMAYLLVWMFSRMIQSDKLGRTAKAEMLQSGATLLMVVFVVAFVGAVEEFTLFHFFGCNPEDQVCKVSIGCGTEKTTELENLGGVLGLLKCRFADKAKSLADIQSSVTEAAETPLNLLNMYISIIGLPIYQGGYAANLWKEVEGYRLANVISTNMLVGLNAAIVIADYIQNNMLAVFLPVGLFLRSFHFTRGIGAFFMALALGMYFIYPVIYVVTDPGFIKPPPPPPEPAGVGAQAPPCYPTFSGLIFSLAQYTQPSSGFSAGKLSVGSIINNAATVYTSVILHPFIALAVTLMFIRYLMNVLGGEPMTFMRMIARVV